MTLSTFMGLSQGRDAEAHQASDFLALVQGVRPFSVKISGFVCVVSQFNPAFHQNSKVFSYWPSL